MKKASTQPTKKPNLIKRLPSTTLKTDDNQDMKKKQTDLMTKPIPQTVAKKTTPQSSQPVSTRRTEFKPKTDTVKQRVITNTKASLTQLKKQSLAPSTTRNVSQPKKPIAGNFNVTVNSPPSTRKPTAEISKVSTSRDRTRTRTLKPEEVTALKQIPHISNEADKEKPKTPISFDIHFKSSKPSSSSSANTKTVNPVAATGNEDDDQYESEFESYESDFESGSSKKSISSSASTRSSCSSESSSSTSSDSSSSSDEEHGKSQTNIEQKLDSGNYDMKMKRLLTVNENGNSFMTEPKLEDNQPDSGMNSGMFENHSASSSTKILQKRYADILEKISFNTMIFELYEDQPAPYEYFVKNYGRPKDVQNYTQTETDTHSSEVQTDNIHLKSAWIQHPPQFSLVCLNNMNADPEAFMKEKLGVSQENFNFENSIVQQNDKFSDFLDNLESNKLPNICKTQLTNTLNYKLDGLRSFLNRSLHAVEAVLVRNTENCDKSVTKILDLNLQTTPFNSTVTSAYYDSKSRHVLLTLHECDVEKSFHRYVISVWDTRNCIRPKVILSCWSIVTCTELIGPIILGGTTDGTLCLWDMENNNEELAAPLQLIACNQSSDDAGNCHYGSIVAVRSSNQTTGCTSMATYQVITLFEAGILITWSISRALHAINSDNNCDLNTIFHHCKFHLIQQSVMNLRSMIHRTIMPSNEPDSRGASFLKGSLEDLLNSKNNTNDECRGFDVWSNSDMQISNNKAFVLLDRKIMVVNYLEQKCTLVMKNQERTLSLTEHPVVKGFMFTISSDNMINVLKIHKSVGSLSSLGSSSDRSANQQCTPSSMKQSPILNNKSCAIQNIVKNERKLYHEASSHADSLPRSLSSHLSENQHITHHSDQRSSHQIPLYHNQRFFLKQLDQRKPWLHFLSRGRVLCIGIEGNARFIDLKTGQESYLSDYIGTVDAGKRRLLGTTDKQMIMTKDRQGVYLHDISSSFKST